MSDTEKLTALIENLARAAQSDLAKRSQDDAEKSIDVARQSALDQLFKR